MFTQKRSLTAVVIFLVFAFSHAKAVPAAVETSLTGVSGKKLIYEVNVNELIDDNMDALRNILTMMDPTDLRDMKFPITPHIYMNLHTGWLQNVSLLKRESMCTLKYTEKVITIDMTFGWDEIAFDYRYLLKVLWGSRKGDLHGQLSALKVNVVLDIDLANYQVALKQLNFIETGKITIKLEGHRSDSLYNHVIKCVTKLLKNQVLEIIEKKATDMIQLELDELNLQLGQHMGRQFTFVNLVESRHDDKFIY